MMNEHDDPIPRNYQAWRHCIEHWCGIPLTREFIEQRLQELSRPEDEHTKKFIESYGQAHHEQVTAWFNEALNDIK